MADRPAPSVADMIAFCRQRAMVERACGENQLKAGNDSGKWRVDRGAMLSAVAARLKATESMP